MSNKNYRTIQLAEDAYSQRKETAKSLKKEELKSILSIEKKELEMIQLVNQLKSNFKEAEDLINQFDTTLLSIKKKE